MAEGRADTPHHGMSVAPDNKTLWVTSVFANAVFVYSLPELTLQGYLTLPELKLPGRAPIGALPNWATFPPDGKLRYVTTPAITPVASIDTQAMQVPPTLPAGH